MPLGLVALALGGFGIGLTEFVIMGLLPEVATDFGVSEVAAGWLITGYALSVVVGALGVTAAVLLPAAHATTLRSGPLPPLADFAPAFPAGAFAPIIDSSRSTMARGWAPA